MSGTEQRLMGGNLKSLGYQEIVSPQSVDSFCSPSKLIALLDWDPLTVPAINWEETWTYQNSIPFPSIRVTRQDCHSNFLQFDDVLAHSPARNLNGGTCPSRMIL